LCATIILSFLDGVSTLSKTFAALISAAFRHTFALSSSHGGASWRRTRVLADRATGL